MKEDNCKRNDKSLPVCECGKQAWRVTRGFSLGGRRSTLQCICGNKILFGGKAKNKLIRKQMQRRKNK